MFEEKKNNIFNKMPYFIDPCAKKAIAIYFLILPEHQLEAFNAVKNSTLPGDLIDYLTGEGTFKKVLAKAGFGVGSTLGENVILQCFAFRKVLGKYNEDLFNIIAPYILTNSYIEMKTDDGLSYRWKFDGSTCKKIYQD